MIMRGGVFNPLLVEVRSADSGGRTVGPGASQVKTIFYARHSLSRAHVGFIFVFLFSCNDV